MRRKSKVSAKAPRKARAQPGNRASDAVVRRRDDFPVSVLRFIAHEVGHRCSNPDCAVPTSGPSKEKGLSNVGVGAHITAAAPGGPRYDASLSPTERRSVENAIWLCGACGRLVDNDTSTYTVAELAEWKKDAIARAQQALASGGRSTTDGLLAAQLEVQKQALGQLRDAHDAQIREQRLSKFGEVYGRFLETAKAYARAIEEYWTWMHKTAFLADRRMREQRQRSVGDARAAFEAALQPVVLNDADEARGSLRWELLRKRGLEPLVDTIENQRAYASVIHHHQLRLLEGIGRLQENVRQALGLSVRPRTSEALAFEEEMLAQAKSTADAVRADIKSQFDVLMRRRREDSVGASTAAGLRTRVWNVLHEEVFEDDQDDEYPDRRGEITIAFLREIWRDVLVRPLDEIPNDAGAAWGMFRRFFMSCTDTQLYSIVEHAGHVPEIRLRLDQALKEERAPYRFEGDKLVSTSSSA